MAINYTVKEGDTLNKIAQANGFANYKEAGVTSVPSGNFDLIRPGETITLNDQPRSIQQSTTANRIQTQKNSANFDNILANQQNTNLAKSNEASTTTTEDPNKKDNLSDMFDTTSGVGQRISNIQSNAESRVNEINSTFDRISGQMDAATNSLISSIREIYGARIEDLKDSNKRLLASKEQLGIRSGRERYMSNIQSGILTDEEQSGIMRVSKLEGEMLGMIAKTEQARADNDYKMFNSNFDRVNEIYSEMKTEIQNTYNTAIKVEEERRQARAAEIKAQTDEFDQMLDKSERSAPAVASALSKFTNDADKTAFLQAYAKKTGIDIDVLIGDVEKSMGEQQKNQLNLENIKNQISNRNRSQGLAEEKYNFNPSTDERSKVQRYLAKNGDDNDIARARTDQTFFYWVLDQAMASEE